MTLSSFRQIAARLRLGCSAMHRITSRRMLRALMCVVGIAISASTLHVSRAQPADLARVVEPLISLEGDVQGEIPAERVRPSNQPADAGLDLTELGPSSSGALSSFVRTPYPDRLKLRLADELTRETLARLRQTNNPTPIHYRAVARLLRFIQRLDPKDPELVRLEFEAWESAGDTADALRATAKLVRLDPKDTVAQLRLINAKVREYQNADDRLAVYARLLGPGGQSLDASIRSRLALDAALLLREIGDEAGFLDRLTLATTLDVTNKDAAALYATYYLGRTDDPMERADILSNLILSDPLDQEALQHLGYELMGQGAYAGARRMYARTRDILIANGTDFSADQMFDYLLCVWATDGPGPVFEILSLIEQDMYEQIMMQRRMLEMQGRDPGNPQRPLLPPKLQLLRLAIAVVRNDPVAKKQHMVALGVATEQVKSVLTDPRRRPASMTLLQAEAELFQLQYQLFWAFMLSGLDAAKGARMLIGIVNDERPGAPRLEQDAINRFVGWGLAIEGSTDKARDLLTPLYDKDIHAKWAMHLVAAIEGRRQEATNILYDIAREAPTTLLGVMAHKSIESLTPSYENPNKAAAELDRRFAFHVNGGVNNNRFAPWLDKLTGDPHEYLLLRARHVSPSLNPTDRAQLEILLRNVSRWPLAIGPGQPIDSRLLLSADIRFDGGNKNQSIGPDVIDLARRLRLMPNEELTLTFDCDRGWTGLVLGIATGNSVLLRWRLQQGFLLQQQGENIQFITGPLSVSTTSDILQRARLETSGPPDTNAQHIADAREHELLRALALAGIRLRIVSRDLEDPANEKEQAILASAVIERARDMSPMELTLAMFEFGGLRNLGADADTMRDLLRNEHSPYVAVALLLTTISDPDDEFLNTMLLSDDDEIAALADLFRSLLLDALARKAEAPVTTP